MSDIPSSSQKIQIEATQTRGPTSESLFQTMGGSINWLIDQANSLLSSVSGLVAWANAFDTVQIAPVVYSGYVPGYQTFYTNTSGSDWVIGNLLLTTDWGGNAELGSTGFIIKMPCGNMTGFTQENYYVRKAPQSSGNNYLWYYAGSGVVGNINTVPFDANGAMISGNPSGTFGPWIIPVALPPGRSIEVHVDIDGFPNKNLNLTLNALKVRVYP